MDARSINNSLKTAVTPQSLIVLLCVGAFLPFIFSAVIDIAVFLIILFYPKFNRGIFSYKGALLVLAFCVYAAVVALFNHNVNGLIILPIIFIVFVFYGFVRENMNKETFDLCLTSVCFTVFPAFLFAAFEVIGSAGVGGKYVYRTSSYYGNANYFGAMMAAIVIICAHNVVKKKGRTVFYFVVAVTALINIYLSGSLFAIVEIVVGVAMYLLLSKHYRLFCLMLIVGSAAIVAISAIPELLPRLSESTATTSYRIRMWGVIIKEAKKHLWFGTGFLSYGNMKDLYEGSYYAFHGHNFGLDCIANFGILGTLLLIAVIYYLLKSIVKVYFADKESYIAILGVSIAAAVAAHMFTDMVFLWIQTGIFYMIVFGSIGCEEKRLNLEESPLIFGKIRI